MEKNLKLIKKVVVLLMAVFVAIIALTGYYVKEYGVWHNILPDFKLGMELEGTKELHYVLDSSEQEKEIYVDSEGNYAGDVVQEDENGVISLQTEEGTEEEKLSKEIEGYTIETKTVKVNEEDKINIENFEKAKSILQKRLETLDVYEYNIRQDLVTGEIVVEVPDNDNLNIEQSMISTVGNITIIDSQTGLILIEDSSIKKASMMASGGEGYQAYLRLEFDKEASEKLKEISKTYQKVEKEVDENAESEEETSEEINYISIKMDDQVIAKTYFSEELTTGIMDLRMGQATQDYAEYVEIAKSVAMIADMINQDTMPLAYTLSSDNYIDSHISNSTVQLSMIIISVILVIISLVLIIKYKAEGLKTAILSLGYIGLLSIIIRYTNVVITMNSLIAGVAIIIVNYVFNFRFLNKLKETRNRKVAIGQTLKELYLTIMPICIIAIIFTLMSSIIISSIGMVLFWGIIVQAIYDLLLMII